MGENWHTAGMWSIQKLLDVGHFDVRMIHADDPVCERYLSPFYTLLLGPEPVPLIESLPADRPTPWREADQTLLDLADMINERAGQIFPGEPEYVVASRINDDTNAHV
jgi:hypothetical protein